MTLRSRNSLRFSALLAAFLPVAGCTPATAPAPTTWEATLTSHTPLSGTVAVVSRSDRIRAGIDIEGAVPGAAYDWRLAEGTCEEPGGLIGGRAVYPTLTAGETGSASAEAVIAGTLRPDGTYHAALLTTAPDNGTVIACGALEQV